MRVVPFFMDAAIVQSAVKSGVNLYLQKNIHLMNGNNMKIRAKDILNKEAQNQLEALLKMALSNLESASELIKGQEAYFRQPIEKEISRMEMLIRWFEIEGWPD